MMSFDGVPRDPIRQNEDLNDSDERVHENESDTSMVTDLPKQMEGMGLINISESGAGGPSLTEGARSYGLRQRIPIVRNRRAKSTPRKYIANTVSASASEIKQLYLNKTIKKFSHSLETIYEEPKGVQKTLIGGRKFKRLVHFDIFPCKDKINKRRSKIEKIFNKKSVVSNKIPMELFLKAMELSDSEENTMEVK